MSDRRNLWVGALLGMLLTAGLMFVLYQQSGLVEAERKVTGKSVDSLPDPAAVFAPVSAGGARSEASTQATQTAATDELNATAASTAAENFAITKKAQLGMQQVGVARSRPESIATEGGKSLAFIKDSSADAAAVEMGVLGEKSAPSAELVNALPDGLDLSFAELSELSVAERVEYDAMLQAYREVRAQVLALDQERTELKQRMDKMFEQNDAMEREVKRMRAMMQQLSTED